MTVTRALAAVLAVLMTATLSACGDDADATKKDDLAAPSIRYVALGDSYSSAPQVPDTTGPSMCLRSSNNYPSLVNEELDADTFVDVTCAGADTRDMSTAQYAEVAPQLDAVTADTDIVSIGLGGNEFNLFFTLVGQCAFVRDQDPSGAPCRAAMNVKGKDKLLTTIAATRKRMVDVVRQIRQRAPDAQVLVVGYPQIVPGRGTCVDLLPLADGDYPWARSINKALTDMLATVADRTETTYVDLWRATAGHDICADEPWINGQQGDPERAAPFHPFAEEQEAAAEQVLAAID